VVEEQAALLLVPPDPHQPPTALINHFSQPTHVPLEPLPLLARGRVLPMTNFSPQNQQKTLEKYVIFSFACRVPPSLLFTRMQKLSIPLL